MVSGRARTTYRASDSWPWVLGSEVWDESEGMLCPHGVPYSRVPSTRYKAPFSASSSVAQAKQSLTTAEALAQQPRMARMARKLGCPRPH